MSMSRSSTVKTLDCADVEHQEEAKRIYRYDFMGCTVFVGRNAKANEHLISDHKTKHPKCFWMHVVGRRGPHVVLCVGYERVSIVDPIVMRYAASYALKFAGLKVGSVSYAKLEDIYKPEKSNEGTYRTWRNDTIEL